MSQSSVQTINKPGAPSHPGGSRDQRPSRLDTDGWELQQPGGNSLQLQFQDSNLSPALAVLPTNPGVEVSFTEYSLIQRSDMEFAPIRALPDISTASERFDFPPQDSTTQFSDCGSLFQHPLAQATILSEEGVSRSYYLSQLSLSPQEAGNQEEMINTASDMQGAASSIDGSWSKKKDTESQTDPLDKPVGVATEDETYFLSKDIPAQHLLELLQRHVGMPSSSSSSSAVSSAAEAPLKSTSTSGGESKCNKTRKTSSDHSTVQREGPLPLPLPQQQTQEPDRSKTLSSEICNISMGSRSTRPDETSDLLHRELLSETERGGAREAQSKGRPVKCPKPPGQSAAPRTAETPEDKQRGTRATHRGMSWTGPLSAGHRERDPWSSGSQTGIDGSYLGFLPQSQSTPGVFKAPPKSGVKCTLGQLSAIESNKESSYEWSPGFSAQQAEAPRHSTADQGHVGTTSAKVQSLPSLNYIQKVDAWRENQSSGKTSMFDSLALPGVCGTSPQKKAFGAGRVSLSQQSISLRQPPVSNTTNQNVQSAASSPRRGEAVGSVPSQENSGFAAQASSSPVGRSQSHSSLSTVVMAAQKDQQTEQNAVKETNQNQTDEQASATVEPPPLLNLGRVSDESPDVGLISSYISGIRSGASVGASSVVSLEVDNYAPYWTSKLSTPPPEARPRQLNIGERIPLYLHNLGVDQGPSTISTPFAPRGPIREPESSPPDLCTVRGSMGTLTRSTQPSEEFCRCSVLSVDSIISTPFSLDSLGPAVSVPENTKASSSDTAAGQSHCRLPPRSQSEDPPPSTLQSSQQQQMDSSLTSSQNTVQQEERVNSDLSSYRKDRDLESPMGAAPDEDRSCEESFVNSQALTEIHNLLSQTEKTVSAGSSAASSSSPAAPPLLSDHLFVSLGKKTVQPKDFSFTPSSTAGEPRTPSSFLRDRSSSDSTLTSEKQREKSVGQESSTSDGQPASPGAPAVLPAPGAPADVVPQHSRVFGGAASSLVTSQSAQRAEPEGCSAAPPDNAVPPQPPANNPPPAGTTQQPTSTPAGGAGRPDVEIEPPLGSPTESSSSSPVLEDPDPGVMSDGSSGSSLAVRVNKLLSDSPATAGSSTPSTTEPEGGKARVNKPSPADLSVAEWMNLKTPGLPELDREDRRRIEEIKRELLLKKSQGSTDTESSAASSGGGPPGQDLPPPTETFTTFSNVHNQPPSQLQQPTDLLRTHLEAQIREIAAREGVTLPRTNDQALTSTTIATCRRSTPPSPSASLVPPHSPTPEPLNLIQLSTGTVEHPERNHPPTVDEGDQTTRESSSVFEPSSCHHTKNLTCHSSPGSQRRPDAVAGQYEQPPPSWGGSDGEEVDVEDNNTQAFKQDDELSSQDRSAAARCPVEEPATISSTSDPPGRTSHVSHVHLTFPPKATGRSSPAVLSSHSTAALLPKDFVPLRQSSSALSSPDEGVGLSSPPEWNEPREPIGPRPERADTSTQFRTSTTPQSFKPPHRVALPRLLTTETPAASVLLPYKPPGSEELFYVPQTEADVSSTSHSDTTVESSHTGSDDAVPPHFSSDVLGHKNPELDRGVTIRHTEGIYSKRLKTAGVNMPRPEHRGAPVAADRSSPTSVAGIQRPSLSHQGTSPVQVLGSDQPSRECHQAGHVRTDGELRRHMSQSSVPGAGVDRGQQRRDTDLHHQSSRTLDRLQNRSSEEARPTADREASLLQRLERLSRLIHSSGGTNVSGQQGGAATLMRQTTGEVKKSAGDETRRVSENSKPPVPPQTWTQRPGGASHPSGGDSRASLTSSFSLDSQSQHLCPADGDKSEVTSGSMSTVDTARLIRAFGAHRVHLPETSSSLNKLYTAIGRQRDVRAGGRGGTRRPPQIVSRSESVTDESSIAVDSSSSTCTDTGPSHHRPSGSLEAKKAVKQVSRGVQAGDLEIVSNATRRHTRDVGTTFPSPGEDRAPGKTSSSSSSVERPRGRRSPSKTQGIQKQRKSRRNTSPPKAVSWFISAGDLRTEARKENRPEEEESARRPSTAWFEMYRRTVPWREPLSLRQVHDHRIKPPGLNHPAEGPDPRSKTMSSGLTPVSLQEALEMRRPDFIFRSRQRVDRLTVLTEERKLHADFSRDGDQLSTRPGGLREPLRPAGSVVMRRAVPRKEMIQRSKQIYEQLPEVQRRKDDERRRAEYRSYRLNAKLYNKRITGRVLGRRTAWQ